MHGVYIIIFTGAFLHSKHTHTHIYIYIYVCVCVGGGVGLVQVTSNVTLNNVTLSNILFN